MKSGLLIVFGLALGVCIMYPSQCIAQVGAPILWGRPSAFSINFAFSHSGKTIALSNDTGLAFMDLHSKRIIRSFSMPQSYCGYRQMVFAPRDSALFLIGCQWYQLDEPQRPNRVSEFQRGVYSIGSLNLHSGKLTTLDSDFHDCKVAFAGDGIRFAVLTSLGELSLHKIGRHGVLHSVQMPPRREWPNEYTISFSADGSKLIAYWYGQLLIYDARTLGSRIYIEDSLEWGTPEVLGSTVFLSRNPLKDTPILIDMRTGREAMIQPPFLNAQYSYRDKPPVNRNLHPVGAALISNEQYLIARYEVHTTGVPFEGGPRAGVDSLLVTPLAHPEQRWGIPIDPAMGIGDVLKQYGIPLVNYPLEDLAEDIRNTHKFTRNAHGSR